MFLVISFIGVLVMAERALGTAFWAVDRARSKELEKGLTINNNHFMILNSNQVKIKKNFWPLEVYFGLFLFGHSYCPARLLLSRSDTSKKS